MIWLLMFPVNVVIMLMCYITNPLVCLFCNEVGELPKIFKMWQTWDDSCDPRFFVVDKVAKIFKYDYDRHYEEYWGSPPELAKYGKERCYVRLKDSHFTIKERIQRYFCRVLWLTRNCGYGWAFYLFARDANKATSFETGKYIDEDHFFKYGWDKSQNIFIRTWWVKFTWYWTKNWFSEGYIGWKINLDNPGDIQHGMIAQRVIPINYDLDR